MDQGNCNNKLKQIIHKKYPSSSSFSPYVIYLLNKGHFRTMQVLVEKKSANQFCGIMNQLHPLINTHVKLLTLSKQICK